MDIIWDYAADPVLNMGEIGYLSPRGWVQTSEMLYPIDYPAHEYAACCDVDMCAGWHLWVNGVLCEDW